MKEINKVNKISNVHFFPYQKFTEPMIHFFNTNYDEAVNLFILYGNKIEFVGDLKKTTSYSNVIELENLSKNDFKNILKHSNKIILHYLFNYNLFFKIYFYSKKPVHILFWGSDIEYLKGNNLVSIRSRIMYKIRFTLFKQAFKNIIPINLIDSDFVTLSNIMKINLKKNYIARYFNNNYKEDVFNLAYKHNNNCTKILLGNSATKTNNHVEIIDLLIKFQNDPIKVYIPLSYGSKEYGDYIENYAKERLKDKVVVLRDYMDPKDYNKFLNEMDIGIFNYYRQQGLGNINRLLALRKKVYINPKSGLFDYYQKKGLKIYSTDLIKKMKYFDFINFDKQELNKNKDILINDLSEEVIKGEWDKVLSE